MASATVLFVAGPDIEKDVTADAFVIVLAPLGKISILIAEYVYPSACSVQSTVERLKPTSSVMFIESARSTGALVESKFDEVTEILGIVGAESS